jgi:hypothetical protein
MKSDDRPSAISDPDGANSAIPYMGTLVIRTWYEPGQVPGFRARLTYSSDPEGEPKTVSTADRDEALSIVRQWLFAQSGSPGDV